MPRPLLLVALLALSAHGAEPSRRPLAHAHNDYEHARPLLDALERGFDSVEADIHLVDGRLLVAHDRKDVRAERTLEALYLDPLRERARRQGGRIHPGGGSLTLLVDVKTEAVATYRVLDAVLAGYADLVTRFRGDTVVPGAVTILLSGNRALAEIAAQAERRVAIDGRRIDLERNSSPRLVPWVSENWRSVFAWRWEGAMPAGEREALRQWVSRAHAQGRQVRFWNTPDRPEAWRILVDAGVDVIGTDDLQGLQEFLRANPR